MAKNHKDTDESGQGITMQLNELTKFTPEPERAMKLDNPLEYTERLDQFNGYMLRNVICTTLAYSVVGYLQGQLTRQSNYESFLEELDEGEVTSIDRFNETVGSETEDELGNIHRQEIGFRGQERLDESVVGTFKTLLHIQAKNVDLVKQYTPTTIKSAIDFLMVREPVDRTSELLEALDITVAAEIKSFHLPLDVIQKGNVASIQRRDVQAKATLKANAEGIMGLYKQAERMPFDEGWHKLPTVVQYKIGVGMLNNLLTRSIPSTIQRVKREALDKNTDGGASAQLTQLLEVANDLRLELKELYNGYGHDAIEAAFDAGTLQPERHSLPE